MDIIIQTTCESNKKILLKEMSSGRRRNYIFLGVYESKTLGFPCQINAVKQFVRKLFIGIIFQPNWPYTKLFNHELEKMRESGLFNKYESSYFRPYDRMTQYQCGETKSKPISIHQMASLAIILWIGVGLTILIFIVEYYYYYYRFAKNVPKSIFRPFMDPLT